MSTRSNLIVQDQYDRIQLYRHFDGYPDTSAGVLATLPEALKFAWPLPRFEAQEFATAIIRAWKQEGGNIYIDGNPKAWEMIHNDVEWVYLIRKDNEEPVVEVYDWHHYWNIKTKNSNFDPKPINPVLWASMLKGRAQVTFGSIAAFCSSSASISNGPLISPRSKISFAPFSNSER